MSVCSPGMICSMSEVRDQRWVFEHTHLKMSWIQHQIIQRDGVLGYPPPLSPPSSYGDTFHKEPSSSSSSSSGTRISPAVLFIIIILAVLFFISGLLHLLVRFLMKHPTSSTQSNDRYPEVSSSDALQRQLQQLFHLHDSGLDQAFIDALPVFMYKEIVGASKEPFDCAVCLCEFSGKDKLRLLPMCSHAFHINCIDTWLLTNSTCPLCRGTLFTPGLNIENPIFDFDDLREDDGFPSNGENRFVLSQKTVEVEEIIREKGVIPVRLGKFRKLDDGAGERDVGETSSSNLDARRCYSMGSYQYVVGDTNLRVPLSIDREGRDVKRVKGIEYNNNPTIEGDDVEGKKISIGSKTDSYSVSKIWLWSKKGKFASSSETQ